MDIIVFLISYLTMENLLTVIIQTSPVPSHPSTSLIDALFNSFDRVDGLKSCNIVLLCDGCDHITAKDENNKLPQNYKHGSTLSNESYLNYRLYLNQLREKIKHRTPTYCPTDKGSILLLELPKRYGSASALEAVFPMFSATKKINDEFICTYSAVISPILTPTPYVMVGQHDNFFVEDVNYLPEILQYMQRQESSWLQCLHFPSTATLNYVEKIKRRYQLDLQPFCRECNNTSIKGRFVPLMFWYGRTHIARWEYYTQKILSEYPLHSGDHLEEIWGTAQLKHLMGLKKKDSSDDFDFSFRQVHELYGNYVFFERSLEDDAIEEKEVLYHLSGRKARAVPSSQSDATNLMPSVPIAKNSTRKQSFTPHDNSFTTARRATAVVPGLEIVTTSSSQKPPKGRFKQRCFHCGEKGHSFKYCPNGDRKSNMPEMEVLNLS